MSNDIRIAMVTTMQPESHVSRFLAEALEDIEPIALVVEKDPANDRLPYRNVYQEWAVGGPFRRNIVQRLAHLEAWVAHVHHEFNMYGARGLFEFPSLLKDLKRRNIATFVTIHAVVVPSRIDKCFLRRFGLPLFPAAPLFYKLAFTAFYRALLRHADLVHVHSEESREVLIREYGAKRERTTVIPLGIPPAPDHEPPKPNAQWTDLTNDKTVLFFGYLLPRKGLEELIEAIRILQRRAIDARLIIAGGDLPRYEQYADSLRERVRSSDQAQKIGFTGFVSYDEILWLAKHSALMTLPYTSAISSSLPSTFALQCNIPIVASDLAQFREILAGYQFGLLAKPGNAEELADAIQMILSDPEKRKKMALEAGRAARDRSWANIAGRYHTLYERLAAHSRPPRSGDESQNCQADSKE